MVRNRKKENNERREWGDLTKVRNNKKENYEGREWLLSEDLTKVRNKKKNENEMSIKWRFDEGEI